jgi:hypothetical protein
MAVAPVSGRRRCCFMDLNLSIPDQRCARKSIAAARCSRDLADRRRCSKCGIRVHPPDLRYNCRVNVKSCHKTSPFLYLFLTVDEVFAAVKFRMRWGSENRTKTLPKYVFLGSDFPCPKRQDARGEQVVLEPENRTKIGLSGSTKSEVRSAKCEVRSPKLEVAWHDLALFGTFWHLLAPALGARRETGS